MRLDKAFRLFSINILLLTSFNLMAANIRVNVVDINDKPIQDIIVYLVPLDSQILDVTNQLPVVIYQADKAFTPYASVIQKGSSLSFNNKDDITHHIYSVASKNHFSFRIKSGKTIDIEPLTEPGKVIMGCNIHDWMSGYLLVVDTPLFSKTKRNGETNIEVPALGRYKLIIWHPEISDVNQSVTKDITVTEDVSHQIKLSKTRAEYIGQENPEP